MCAAVGCCTFSLRRNASRAATPRRDNSLPFSGAMRRDDSPKIDDAEVVSTPDEIRLELTVGREFDGDILFGDIGGDVFEAGPENVIAFGCYFGSDETGRGFETDGGDAGRISWHETARDHGHGDGNGAVPTHVEYSVPSM